MRKIHITESQLSNLKKMLSEATPVDATDATNDNNGNIAAGIRQLQQTNPALKNNATYTVNPDGLKNMEESSSVSFTKKQIKEEKIKRLRENSVVYKKKNLKNK